MVEASGKAGEVRLEHVRATLPANQQEKVVQASKHLKQSVAKWCKADLASENAADVAIGQRYRPWYFR